MAVAASADIEALAQLGSRDFKALTESMDVYADDPAAGPTEVAVYSSHMEDGVMVSECYLVSPDTGFCTCGDTHYNAPAGNCKHWRRVMYERGESDLPAGIDTSALAMGLREHIDDRVSQ